MQRILRSALALAMILALAPMATVSAQVIEKRKSGAVVATQKSVSKPTINKPVVSNNSGNRKSNRNLGIGIGAAIVGAAIIGGIASQSEARPSYYSRPSYRDHDGLSCGQLERRCDDGQEWACRKLSRSERC
jgi:hypothetical protein